MKARRNPQSHSDRPFVLINMAMTADGKIATTNRAVSSFGSRRDKTHMLELRATADAVMCGARTVDHSDASLGPGGAKFRQLRTRRGLAEYNLRIVVSGSGSVNPEAPLFKKRFSPIIVLTTKRAGAQKLERLRVAADTVEVFGRTEVDLRAALRWLRGKWNVRRLICEGGGELNDAMFRAGLVDELHLTVCPLIFGGRHAPTIATGTGFETLAAAAQLELSSSRRVGDELFLVYRTCKT
jgi:riboflavin-specific deaminase-like protein